jgi:hypothetical protein
MSTRYTPYLKLSYDTSKVTQETINNLNKIDRLASSFVTDTTGQLRIRSAGDIYLLAAEVAVGGSGSGGKVYIGSSVSPVELYAYATNLNTSLVNFADQVPTSAGLLSFQYLSSAGGTPDLSGTYVMSWDPRGANRTVVLGGNFSIQHGVTFLSSGNASLTLPVSGTLATLAGAETLTGKSIDATANTITNINNGNLAAGAAIVYSKLDLTDSIIDADVAAAAAIAYSKLNLANAIKNTDVSASAAIDYSKLNLTASVVDLDIAPTAAIVYSKLALSNSIVNADIASGAAIDGTKIDADFGTQEVLGGSFSFKDGSYKVTVAASGLGGNYTLYWPAAAGSPSQVLAMTSGNRMTWVSVLTSGLPENYVDIGDSSGSRISVDTATLGDIAATVAGGFTYKAGSIENADVAGTAGIVYSKLSLTSSIVDADVSNLAAIAWTKISKSGSALDDMADVTAPTPATGEFLGWSGTAWTNQRISNTLTVGASGCNYTTIQAAIDAASPSASAWTRINVMPGTYTENITLKPYVQLVGSAIGLATTLNGKVRFSGSGGYVLMEGFTVNYTPTATNDAILLYNDPTGWCILKDIGFNSLNSFNYATALVDITGTESVIQNAGIFCVNVNASTQDIIGLKTTTSSVTQLRTMAVNMVMGAASGTVTAIKDASTADAYYNQFDILVQNTNAAFAGTSVALYSDTVATGKRITSNFSVKLQGAGAGTAIGFYLDTPSGGGKFSYNSNDLYIDNYTTKYRAFTGAADSQFLSFQSHNTLIENAGTGTTLTFPYDDRDSGLVAWEGSGDYWSIASTDQFTVLRRCSGRTRSTPTIYAGGSTVTLTAGVCNYVYFDTNGTLGVTSTATDALYSDCVVLFQVHLDAAGVARVVAEDHPYRFDSSVSREWHLVFGTLIYGVGGQITRVATGTGGAAGDRQLKVAGTAYLSDHGLTTTIPDSSGAAVTWNFYYTDPSTGKWTFHSAATEFPMVYNQAGVGITPLGGLRGGFRCYVSKASLNSALPTYIAVIGTDTYANQTAANTAIANQTIATVTAELEELELAQLGQVSVFDSGGGYLSNVTVQKKTAGTYVGTSAATSSSASLITTVTTSFTGALSAADTNVQAALDTLDKSPAQRYSVAKAAGDWTLDTDYKLVIAGATHARGTLAQGIFLDSTGARVPMKVLTDTSNGDVTYWIDAEAGAGIAGTVVII